MKRDGTGLKRPAKEKGDGLEPAAAFFLFMERRGVAFSVSGNRAKNHIFLLAYTIHTIIDLGPPLRPLRNKLLVERFKRFRIVLIYPLFQVYLVPQSSTISRYPFSLPTTTTLQVLALSSLSRYHGSYSNNTHRRQPQPTKHINLHSSLVSVIVVAFVVSASVDRFLRRIPCQPADHPLPPHPLDVAPAPPSPAPLPPDEPRCRVPPPGRPSSPAA